VNNICHPSRPALPRLPALLSRARKQAVLGLLFLPLAALAQQPEKAPAAVPPASWKSLKFPPLREIQLPKIEETTLPNGMKVYLLENHELPLAKPSAAAAPRSSPAIRSTYSSKTSPPTSKAKSEKVPERSASPR